MGEEKDSRYGIGKTSGKERSARKIGNIIGSGDGAVQEG